jgi:rRNA maturation endonuclease Nob1
MERKTVVIDGVEYEEVIHAKWNVMQVDSSGLFKVYECTNCGKLTNDGDSAKICDACGAHMDA